MLLWTKFQPIALCSSSDSAGTSKNWIHRGQNNTTDIPYLPNNKYLKMTRGYLAEILYTSIIIKIRAKAYNI